MPSTACGLYVPGRRAGLLAGTGGTGAGLAAGFLAAALGMGLGLLAGFFFAVAFFFMAATNIAATRRRSSGRLGTSRREGSAAPGRARRPAPRHTTRPIAWPVSASSFLDRLRPTPAPTNRTSVALTYWPFISTVEPVAAVTFP